MSRGRSEWEAGRTSVYGEIKEIYRENCQPHGGNVVLVIRHSGMGSYESPWRRTVWLLRPVNIAANSRVKPRRSILPAHKAHPPNMYGLLRPQRDVELSASTPINGCIRNPDRGPARNTMAIFDLVRPRDSKYGDAITPVNASRAWGLKRSAHRMPLGQTMRLGHLGDRS
jgi:hypothetical protein